MSLSPAYRLHSLNSTIDVIETLAGADRELGVSEVAAAIGLSKGATHRILANLVERGYVESVEGGRYRLGLRLWEMGQRVPGQRVLRNAARPFMEQALERIGESVLLVTYDHGDVVYLERIATEHAVQTYLATGARGEAHAAASGKVLLAHQPAREQQRYLAQELRRYTENTVTDPAVLEAQLREVRTTGFASIVGERQLDVNGVAAPVRDATGRVVAALGIAAPAYRFTADVAAEAAEVLVQCSDQLSAALGFRGQHEVDP